MSEPDEASEKAINDLRHELKIWEKAFAASNGGRKPERADMKNDATISMKYLEYKRLTKKSANSQPIASNSPRAQSHKTEDKVLKERSCNAIAATPRKQSKNFGDLKLPAPAVIAEEEQPTPACVRVALGPTPQKDGEILGIFDMLPTGTPSKTDAELPETSLPAVEATPSKPSQPLSSTNKLSRTPQSSGKRFFLDAFAGTPLKRKRDNDVYTPSTAKRQFATPSFLRRNIPLKRVDEEDDISCAAPPLKKRGLVRSLSAIIQGLKKQEEERMDDDWDVMNEIEAEERGEVPSRPNVPKVLVEDSQGAEMPLGPDQGVESDEEDDDDPGALDANGKPRKVWKKKGLKRQTRRVIMRPVMHKPVDAATLAAKKSLRDDDEAEKNAEELSDVDFNPEDTTGVSEQKQSKEARGKKPNKSSAQAHQNFRKLKIKNKNSKANGRGRKFGRR